MSSLIDRSLSLASARFATYAIMLLSPVFLVRILTVEQYGFYRQFVIYALLITSLITYSIPGNLLYFLAKDTKRAQAYVSNSIFLILGTTILGLSIVYFTRPGVLGNSSTEYILLLCAYVFFYTNLDFIIVYWIATKRPQKVLLYSATRVSGRMAAIVLTAYFTRDVGSIFRAMVVFELIKFCGLFFWWIRQDLLSFHLGRNELKQQMQFILPFGAGTLLYNLNHQLGLLLVASLLGPAPLAIFAIASYQVPVIDIARSALADTVFPEMVSRAKEDASAAIHLWKRTNVLYCFAIFPMFFILFTYAETLIGFVFTSQYLAAVPVFHLLLFLLFRQTFDFGLLVRSRNRTIHFVIANAVALVINVTLCLWLIGPLGLRGPAIALIVSDFLVMFYLATTVLRLFRLPIRELLMWKEVAMLMGCATLCAPLLLLVDRLIPEPVLAAVAGTAMYLGAYYWLCKRLDIAEVDYLIQQLNTKLKLL